MTRTPTSLLAFPWQALFLAAVSGCSRHPLPCAAPSACGSGRTCLLGRCAPANWEPAPALSQRMVVAPSAMAVVSSRGEDDHLPQTVAFGAESRGTVVLLVRF